MDSGLISNCRSVFSPVSCVVWCFFGYRLLSVKSFTCSPGESEAIITLLWFCCRYQEKMPWRRQHWNHLAWLEAMPLSGWEKQSLVSLFSLSTLVLNLFCFKYQKRKKKKSHKRRFQTKTSWHSEVIAFACLSQTAAQMCFSQQQMLALTSHVQIKRACLFVSFFSSSFEWNGQFKVKSLSERAISYHFILPCSGSQALNSQPLQALLAVGGRVGDRGNLSVISWPAPCSIYRRQEWLEVMFYNWLLFFSGRQFSSGGAGPCSVILHNSLTLYPTLHSNWTLFSVNIWKKKVVKSGCIWVSCCLCVVDTLRMGRTVLLGLWFYFYSFWCLL